MDKTGMNELSPRDADLPFQGLASSKRGLLLILGAAVLGGGLILMETQMSAEDLRSLGDLAAALVFAVVVMFGYFIPTVVAGVRKHHNAVAIGALNFFLGWTVLGWVGALVWALTRVEVEPEQGGR